MSPLRVNSHASALASLERWVLLGSALALGGVVGLRVAVDVYSGPSTGLGLSISVGTAVAVCLSLVCVPDRLRPALAYIVGFLLM